VAAALALLAAALPVAPAALAEPAAPSDTDHHWHQDHQHQHQPQPQPQHHQHQEHEHHGASQGAGHGAHSHEVGPAGATYDLRFLDAMVEHHTGALRMSELVLGTGSPGVGALARQIWDEQAREIRAMGLWRRAWYPDAPAYPVVLRDGGDPDSLAGLRRMSPAEIEAMRMMADPPSRDTRVVWFLEGMLLHHGGALLMAHDALARSTNTTVRRLSREVIVAQRAEIIALRRMLQLEGLSKSEYHQFDHLFSLR
jgi:uncharacterized protein (DUF305 family)